MRDIRPYQIFTLLDAVPPERVAQVKIPNRRDLWLLETFILITAVRLVKAKRIFDFGTFFGSTTLNLALNSPADAQIFTFDLPKADALAATKNQPDFRVAGERLNHAQPDFTGFGEAEKIKTLLGNSRDFDFSPFKNSMDMVFIDGGHAEEHAQNDYTGWAPWVSPSSWCHMVIRRDSRRRWRRRRRRSSPCATSRPASSRRP